MVFIIYFLLKVLWVGVVELVVDDECVVVVLVVATLMVVVVVGDVILTEPLFRILLHRIHINHICM